MHADFQALLPYFLSKPWQGEGEIVDGLIVLAWTPEILRFHLDGLSKLFTCDIYKKKYLGSWIT